MKGTDILIVEDDQKMRQLLRLYMQKEGFNVLEAPNGNQALNIFYGQSPDLVVLDVMLPDIDGWTICRRIRQNSQVPIIMLTARGDESDKLFGFELGADDYVVKPFSPKELMARIKALLKRAQASTTSPPSIIKYGGLSIDILSRTVTVDGKPVPLTPKEFDLLSHMASHTGQVLSREQLLQNVWGYDFYGDSRTIDAHIKNLRNKLNEYGRHIVTIWGVGYKFDVQI